MSYLGTEFIVRCEIECECVVAWKINVWARGTWELHTYKSEIWPDKLPEHMLCVWGVCVSVSVYLRVFALGPIYNSIISITLIKILPVKGLWTPGLASIGSLLKAQTKQKCAAINENISEYFEILIGFERIDVTINHYQSSDDMLTSIICIGLFQKN